MAENKTKPTDQSVQKFLEGVAHEQRRKDSFIVLEIMKEITQEEPTMWGPSIIGFGNYHYNNYVCLLQRWDSFIKLNLKHVFLMRIFK